MKIDYGKYNDKQLFDSLKEDKDVSEMAFAEIYSRYSQRIFAYCLRMTGNHEDASDIFQETFLKFYSKAKTEQTVFNISAFLLTIARNQCINFKRNKRITTKIEDFNLITNDKDYDEKELLQLLASALELLDFDYREAFILRQYQGLSYKEISLITGELVSTVKNRVWRAKEKIKTILNPYLLDMSK